MSGHVHHPAWPWSLLDGVLVEENPYYTAPPGVVPDEIMDVLTVATWEVALTLPFGISGAAIPNRDYGTECASGSRQYAAASGVYDTGGEWVRLGDPFATGQDAVESFNLVTLEQHPGSGLFATYSVLSLYLRDSAVDGDGGPGSIIMAGRADIEMAVSSKGLPSGEVAWQLRITASRGVSESDYLGVPARGWGSGEFVYAAETYNAHLDNDAGFACVITPTAWLEG